ncbi:TadE/TadG family type IV pilus assembly protein [Brevibacillus agri]|uniref:TadE/TadG family type IV pilus assembly protein n=1 Tax=Brevibacillus agri TaxID=51101 RepID=UPI0018CC8725|nr:Tad domain-containing protein [Brevibacillus agri]MBG9564084.1 hypothetical protein [Brevibacillus agri]
MRDWLAFLRNERGNVTIFTLTIFMLIMLVLFMALFNLSTVFVVKEQASDSAQQAALAAVKPIYDEMEKALARYDQSPMRLKDEAYIKPFVDQAEASIRASHPDWARSEVRYKAIDQVLSNWLPANVELLFYVQTGLAQAAPKLRDVVVTILEANHATVPGSQIVVTADERIQVQTSVRFRSTTFDFSFMPDPKHEEEVYQTGSSRQIGFLHAAGGLFLSSITL